MPRGKRRLQQPIEQRLPSKRIRNILVQASCPPTQPPPPPAPTSRRPARSEDNFSQKRCLSWFHEYTSADEPDTLGPDAMEQFCEDIGVEPENILMLVLAFKMGASQMGFFSKNEWIRGFSELHCDSKLKFKGKLDTLRGILIDPIGFKNIYRYAYDFAKDSDQRSMDTGTAKVMLQLLLGKNWPLYPQFAQFLDQSKYKVINKDQWCNILEFSRTIQNDLSNYDIDGAWPVMLDEFVEWLRLCRSNTTISNNNIDCAISDNISSS